MADEDITLDGKPLQSLRVADLKAALEQRNLPKSGQKNTLIKRLKGALMLENLQRSSSTQSVLQPNSQIGEEMCQNSFIKQYLAKQQELLRQRLEREAQKEDDDDDESPAGPEEDDDEDNDSSSDKHQPSRSQSAVPDLGGDSSFHHQEALETPRVRVQQAAFQQGHGEPPAPSPPRAVASLSVRVVGQPNCQGFPLASPRPQEKEPAGLSQPGSAHPVLNLGRSAKSSAGNHIRDDSDDDDSDDEDEDWGPDPARSGRQKRMAPSLPQLAPNMSSAASRSKRKLQPPQHILPPQVDPIPMQLRHPTPPPSPPPNLFPLPDTPKQSPPDDQERHGLREAQGASFQSPSMQRQDSDSSSHSSSPEPHVMRRPGPLSLLVHKMETEEASSARGLSEETAHSTSGRSGESLPQHESEKERKMKEKKERDQQQELEKERRKTQEQEREKKRSGEKKEEKTRLEEERKRRQREEQEKERKRKEEEKKREEQRVKEEEEKKRKKANDDRMVAETRDSGSSSDSDSKSDSSSRSSSSSSRDKTQTVNQLKKADQKQDGEDEKKTKSGKALEKQNLSKREVSEPSTAEVEPDSESSVAQQPASGSEPESSESRMEESTTPKAFAARKISLSSSKASPARTDGAAAEPDTGNAGGRKRRWGSSTAVTVKKPSISITTDSLKSLIPDIKVNQEAVVDIHPEELYLSGDEENLDTSRDDPDKGIKIRRTVTQVVPSDSQENGQKNEDDDVEKAEEEKPNRTPTKDKRRSSLSDEPPEPQISVKLDGETKKVTPGDSLVRRSISQQKSGVSVTIDDPIRSTRQPSPPRGKVSNIIHVTNLVRPFTLLHLKELLNRTGSVMEEGFWIDKIKSHCYVTYATTEETVATRTALHGVRWPACNPKVLSVDYCEQDELDFHKGILKPKKEEAHVAPLVVPRNRLPPLMPERDRDKDRERDRERERDRGVRDLWAERQREMERREKARGEREWDRDKICEYARPGEDRRRSRSRERERRRRERAKSRERKSDKKEKDEPPAKLLDDLFLKTKSAPCIYWLPLTEEQATRRLLERMERQKEREQRCKEQEEAHKKHEEEKKVEKLKGREKESTTTSGVAASRGANGDRERDRVRDREGDKRKDGSHRSKRPSPGFGSGRRSRSRSNPRERRR